MGKENKSISVAGPPPPIFSSEQEPHISTATLEMSPEMETIGNTVSPSGAMKYVRLSLMATVVRDKLSKTYDLQSISLMSY